MFGMATTPRRDSPGEVANEDDGTSELVPG